MIEIVAGVMVRPEQVVALEETADKAGRPETKVMLQGGHAVTIPHGLHRTVRLLDMRWKPVD